ncbi:MAG: hypothetical protein JWQ19_2113 [Subtercola sp.]|nr:hypothetical protein [Subtercola sp.]
MLQQTYRVSEVLVVADTLANLDLPDDDRIRVIRVGPGAGGNVARQTGVEQARFPIVGLLDDDDEWYEEKIQTQLEAVQSTGDLEGDWIATCRLDTRFSDDTRVVWPDAPIEKTESLPVYLFARKKFRGGHGLIQSSTLLFPRDLAIRVPFDAALPFHQDIGWLMDVYGNNPSTRIVQPWMPLMVFHIAGGSLSRSITVDGSVDWAVKHLGKINNRLVGDFILTQTMNVARQHGSPREAFRVIRLGMSRGRPSGKALVHAAFVTAETSFKLPRSKPRQVGA